MFFKSGHTAKWSENLFWQEANTRTFPIQTWTNFEYQFKVQFFLVNTKANTINTLEDFSYHQGGKTVDNYLDSFQALVSDIGYTNPWILVVKFYQSLWIRIQNQIMTMFYRHSMDTDPEAWY